MFRISCSIHERYTLKLESRLLEIFNKHLTLLNFADDGKDAQGIGLRDPNSISSQQRVRISILHYEQSQE